MLVSPIKIFDLIETTKYTTVHYLFLGVLTSLFTQTSFFLASENVRSVHVSVVYVMNPITASNCTLSSSSLYWIILNGILQNQTKKLQPPDFLSLPPTTVPFLCSQNFVDFIYFFQFFIAYSLFQHIWGSVLTTTLKLLLSPHLFLSSDFYYAKSR